MPKKLTLVSNLVQYTRVCRRGCTFLVLRDGWGLLVINCNILYDRSMSGSLKRARQQAIRCSIGMGHHVCLTTAAVLKSTLRNSGPNASFAAEFAPQQTLGMVGVNLFDIFGQRR